MAKLEPGSDADAQHARYLDRVSDPSKRDRGAPQETGLARAWHAVEVEAALRELRSSPAGLTEEEAASRLRAGGPNALPEARRASLLVVFLRQFQSPLIYLLFLASAIAFAVGEHRDGVVILVVVFANALIGTLQEGRAERSMAALRQIAALKVRVLRGGRERTIDARELVPGDLLVLSAGDAIAADARLIEAAALQTAEAALTGESLPVQKEVARVPEDTALADRRDMAYGGTHVTAGRGRALVVATGARTEVGHIAFLAGAGEEGPTPLERRVEAFGKYLMLGGFAVFGAIVALGLVRGVPVTELLMIAISQLVGIVPEGLPVAMTIALAVGMQRMAARGAIVRRLSAVESLGSTTVICTDKTGTLTRNEMTVTRLYLADGRELSVSGVGYAPDGEVKQGERVLRAPDDPLLAALCEAACACNDASLREDERGLRATGDPTEIALLTLGRKAGVDLSELARRLPRTGEIPFDSRAQMMATEHGAQVFVKGAPEVVLELCATVSGAGGDQPLDEHRVRELRELAQSYAGEALRVLAFGRAEGRLPGAELSSLRGRVTLLGMVGQLDPARDEVADAIARCRRAGVRTVMVTGDHKATGLAIARALRLAGPEDLALDGRELARLSEPELARELPHIAVFARVQPDQKLRIVEALRERGEVVAMTGDGVNDAPALSRAAVGVAMGITGTDVAKEAAKIVITDDNFTTIVRAVEEGRIVYGNVKKAVLLLTASGFAEVLVLLLAVAFGFPPPFAAVQILWNNLVTEGTITVTLAMEPGDGDEMKRPPIPQAEPIVTRAMLGRMALMTTVIAGLTLGFFAYAVDGAPGPTPRARTATFTLLAVCEWFNVLNCRSELHSVFGRRSLQNAWLWGGLAISALLQAAVVYTPALNQIFYTVPLSLRDVGLIVALGSVVLWVEEGRKLVARRRALNRRPRFSIMA